MSRWLPIGGRVGAKWHILSFSSATVLETATDGSVSGGREGDRTFMCMTAFLPEDLNSGDDSAMLKVCKAQGF